MVPQVHPWMVPGKLGNLPGSPGGPALRTIFDVQVALADPVPGVRARAIRFALTCLHGPRLAIRRGLRDGAREPRQTAALALGVFGGEASARGLLHLLRDDLAGRAMTAGGAKRRRAVASNELRVPEDVRGAAAAALGLCGRSDPLPPVARRWLDLAARLRHPHRDTIQIGAVIGLRILDDPAARATLRTIAANAHLTPGVRAWAAGSRRLETAQLTCDLSALVRALRPSGHRAAVRTLFID